MTLLANRGVVSSMPDLGTSGLSWNGARVAASSPMAGSEISRVGTPHQRLQHSLTQRRGGAPMEQTASPPQRLRHIRNTEILHSSLEEPLSSYKALEPSRPHWPTTWRRFHLTHGIRVKDQDTCVIEAKDQHLKTKKGLVRNSSGTVTYSDAHRRRLEIDVMMLAQINNEGIPGGGHAWKPKTLERIFRERTGRRGIWADYEVPFKEFLAIFPKTFEQFGPEKQFVRLRCYLRPTVLDLGEDAISRLACARERGFVEQHPHIEGTVGLHNEDLMDAFESISGNTGHYRPGSPSLGDVKQSLRPKMRELPELRDHRMKVSFKPNTR